jgi:hypothetical protein
MSESKQSRGKLDAVSYAYVLGGVPAMVAFFVILFLLTRAFDLPA